MTARETATGRMFSFKVTNAALLKTLKPGQGVFANFETQQVSVNGFDPCCNITNLAPAAANAIGVAAKPVDPCCTVTALNGRTGEVTLRTTGGQLVTVRPLNPVDSARIAKTLKVGSKVGFDPVDSAVLRAGSRLKLTIPGFTPVDGIVSQLRAH